MFKPTNYEYILSKKRSKISLGLPDVYPYDWFLGGVDSCQVSFQLCDSFTAVKGFIIQTRLLYYYGTALSYLL